MYHLAAREDPVFHIVRVVHYVFSLRIEYIVTSVHVVRSVARIKRRQRAHHRSVFVKRDHDLLRRSHLGCNKVAQSYLCIDKVFIIERSAKKSLKVSGRCYVIVMN